MERGKPMKNSMNRNRDLQMKDARQMVIKEIESK